MSRRWLQHGGLAVAALVIAVAGFTAMASPASAATRITADAGHGGSFIPGRPIPVEVTVEADHLIRGQLAVRQSEFGEAGTGVILDVEVAGGSRKSFIVALPTSRDPFNEQPSQTLAIELSERDRVIARTTANVSYSADQEVVGVLGELAERQLPGAVPLLIDAGVARFVPIDERLLSAPGAFGPVSGVALSESDLAGLAAEVRASLVAFVQDGGHLYVDAPLDAALPGLPSTWQPDGAGRIVAGRGLVVLTGDAFATGRWSGVVEPSAVHTRSEPFQNDFFDGDGSVANSLAHDAGLRVPGLGLSLLMVGVYIVAVGPVLGMILHRIRRQQLAWVLIPAIAVMTTVALALGGGGLRGSTRLSHVTVLRSGDGTDLVESMTALVGSGGDAVSVGGPAHSLAMPASLRPWERKLVSGVQRAERVDARLAGTVGSLRLARIEGRAPASAPMEVDAEIDGGVLRGSIRNNLSTDLEEVVVFSGTEHTRVGDVQASSTATFELAIPPFRYDPTAARRAWPDAGSASVARPEALATLDDDVNAFAPGRVRVIGWSRELSPSLHVDDRPSDATGTTAVVVEVRPRVAGGQPSRPAIIVEQVRGGPAHTGPSPPVFRVILPPGAAPVPVRVVVANVGGSAEVWDGSRWAGIRSLNVPIEVLSPALGPVRPAGDREFIGVAGPFGGEQSNGVEAVVAPEHFVGGQAFIRLGAEQLVAPGGYGAEVVE